MAVASKLRALELVSLDSISGWNNLNKNEHLLYNQSSFCQDACWQLWWNSWWGPPIADGGRRFVDVLDSPWSQTDLRDSENLRRSYGHLAVDLPVDRLVNLTMNLLVNEDHQGTTLRAGVEVASRIVLYWLAMRIKAARSAGIAPRPRIATWHLGTRAY